MMKNNTLVTKLWKLRQRIVKSRVPSLRLSKLSPSGHRETSFATDQEEQYGTKVPKGDLNIQLVSKINSIGYI